MFGLIFGAIGLVASLAGSFIQAGASKQAAEASKRAEDLRERQMNLESARQRRESYRNVLRGRSAALVSSTAQGGTGGSGIAGGLGQITNKGADNIVGVNQGQEIGKGIFTANRQVADAQSLAAFGSGLSNMGQMVSGLKIG